jgi:putative aldouronate transport system substrate-binding protein
MEFKKYYEENHDARPEHGFIYNWVPAMVIPANARAEQFEVIKEVLATGDESLIKTQEQERLWLAYKELFLGEDDPDQTYHQAWGMWMSRAALAEDGGGWGLTMELKDRDLYVWNEYYGDPTPTEIARASTLRDMWKEFSARFVMGDVAEDAFEKFVDDWHNLGGADWTREVNEQYQAINQ